MRVIELSLILFNTSWGVYSIPKGGWSFCLLFVARYYLLVARYFFVQITVKWKLLWVTKEWSLWMVVSKIFSTCKTIFKADIKLQILPELTTLWCIYYNIWAHFYRLLCTWRVRSTRLEEFYTKGVLKNSTNSKENICAGISFAIKL